MRSFLLSALVAGQLLGLVGSTPVAAQPVRQEVSPPTDARRGTATIQVYAYTFRNQAAVDALEKVRPLLSREGTVELQPSTNTLVVRDSLAAITRIVPVLRSFDREPRQVAVEVMIVRAARAPHGDGHRVAELPRWLEEKLRGLLRWDHYALLAKSRLVADEGQRVTHELGADYGVGFQVGLVEGRQVRLEGLSIWKTEGEADRRRQLLGADLNLRLDRPTALGLARSETSDHALMLVLICHEEKPASSRRPGGS